MTLFPRLRFAQFIKKAAVVSTLAVPLLAIIATSSSAYASGSRVHLIVGGREALFMVSPTSDGSNINGPVDFVRLLGADYNVNDSKTVTVTSASGQKFKAPFTSKDDRQIVSMKPLIDELGADQTWDSSSNSLTLRAKILMVKVDGGKLTVVTSYPVDSVSGSLSDPGRAYIDLFGATLGSDATSIPANAPGVKRIRSKQMEFNTVRIALDLARNPTITTGSLPKASNIQLALGMANWPVAVASAIPSSHPPVSSAPFKSSPQLGDPIMPIPGIAASGASTVSTGNPAILPPTGAFRITNIVSSQDPAGNMQIVISTLGKSPDGNPRTVMLDGPARFAVDLQGAALSLPPNFANGQLSVASPVVKAVRWGTYKLNNASCGRIVLDLAHSAQFKIATEATDDGGQQYRITLNDTNPQMTAVPGSSVPDPGATPDLSGRVIVIDPGHGGKDGGAPGANGLWEKDLTLIIGKKVRDTLVASGAKVLMTRDDDTFIPLPDRAQLGVDNQADMFISIHCDSGSARNSNEGSTVYYHGNDSTCKQFAQFVASRLSDSNCGIHNNGTRTDYVRFPGIGFSVLRRSTEPAILVECGYVNNDQDATALQDSGTQQLIAQSVVAGVKDFLGNRVASNVSDQPAVR